MTMMYGLPATVALAAAPVLVRVTLVTVSALTRPTTLKSVGRAGRVERDRVAVGLGLVLGADRELGLVDRQAAVLVVIS